MKSTLKTFVVTLFAFLVSFQSSAYEDHSFNEDHFIIKYKEYSLSSITVIRETISQYIPPKELFDALKINYKKISEDGDYLIIGHSPEEIIFNFEKKIITIDGVELKLKESEYREINSEVFLETNNLAKIFELNFTTHLDTKEIIISKHNNLAELDKYLNSGEKSEIIDTTLNDVEVIGAETEDILAFSEVTDKNFPPVTNENYSEDNLLIFEIGIDDLAYDQLVDIYEHKIENGKTAIYVSLTQFVENLEFSIDVDVEKKAAKGWFIREDNVIDLNFKDKTIFINGHKDKLSPQDYIINGEDIFFLVNNLKVWFPIDYEIKYNAQKLMIYPRVLLPFQEKKIREVKRQTSLKESNRQSFPIVSTPYKQYQIPEADIVISSEFADSDGESPEGSMSYSALFAGDMAKFSTSSYVSGNNKDLTNLRVSGERKDLDNNLFNSTKISEFSFGDISAYSAPLISGSEIGIGASVSTYPISRSDKFDKTILEGDIQPNWEVELYRNAQLLSFQTAGVDGRYKFEDIDILYGENVFKLVFYGPQGEIKEETKKIFIAHNILKTGEYNYKISANRRNQTISSIKTDGLEKGNRLVLQGEYGFAENLTLSSTLVADEFVNDVNQKETYIFQQFQFTKKLLGGITNTNFAYNYNDNGLAFQQSYVSRFFETNLNFRQEFYDNYINKSRVGNANPIQYQNNLSLNRVVNIPHLKNSTLNLDLGYINFDNGKGQVLVTQSFSSVVGGYSFTNNLSGRFDNSGNENVSGSFSLRTNYNKGFYKIDAGYQIHPTSTLDSISLSTQRILRDNLSLRLDINQPISGNNVTTFGQSLNYTDKRFIFGLTSSMDTNANYTIGANLSFTLYKNPNDELNMTSDISAEQGSVLSYAFMDDNMNGTYEEATEEMLEDITFLRGSKEIPHLDKQYVYSRKIPNYIPTNISIDTNSLDDPLWYPSKKGYSVISRRGLTTKLAFPIVKTAEVDGTIYLEGATNGGNGTISGMTIYLIDEFGSKVSEAISEYDGYFMFEKVVAGRYFIIASETQLNDLGLKQEEKTEVNVTYEDDYYMDNNINIINTGTPKKKELEDNLEENLDSDKVLKELEDEQISLLEND